MRLCARAALVALAAIAAAAITSTPANAQDSAIVTGVIAGISRDQSGALESFQLLDAQGQVRAFTVRGGDTPTEYGLENQAGDRWVSNQAEEPVEAARRLADHQERFAAVTVRGQDGVALSVVEAESGRLETNLGFLFAVYAVTWLAFFAYIWYVSQRQRDLRREVSRLREMLERRGGES